MTSRAATAPAASGVSMTVATLSRLNRVLDFANVCVQSWSGGALIAPSDFFFLPSSIVGLRHFPLWACFPAPMGPEILPRVGSHRIFDGLGVALGDVVERVVLPLPVGRID